MDVRKGWNSLVFTSTDVGGDPGRKHSSGSRKRLNIEPDDSSLRTLNR